MYRLCPRGHGVARGKERAVPGSSRGQQQGWVLDNLIALGGVDVRRCCDLLVKKGWGVVVGQGLDPVTVRNYASDRLSRPSVFLIFNEERC